MSVGPVRKTVAVQVFEPYLKPRNGFENKTLSNLNTIRKIVSYSTEL